MWVCAGWLRAVTSVGEPGRDRHVGSGLRPCWSVLPSPPYHGHGPRLRARQRRCRLANACCPWTGWCSPRGSVTRGGLATSGPGASASFAATPRPHGNEESYVDVFVRGTDGEAWHLRRTPTGVWSTWQPIGGQITSDPDSAANATDTGVDVVARGVDDAVWMRHADDTAWGPWFSLGGQVTSGPSISSDGTTSVVTPAASTAPCGRGRSPFKDGLTGIRSVGLPDRTLTFRVYNGQASILVRGVDGHRWRSEETRATAPGSGTHSATATNPQQLALAHPAGSCVASSRRGSGLLTVGWPVAGRGEPGSSAGSTAFIGESVPVVLD